MVPFKNVNRVVISGVGLIGGSIGLALKNRGFSGKVVGLGRRWSSLKNAINAGAIDSASMDFSEALEGADLLIIGTPVDTIPSIFREAIKHVPKGCIITDVGSTKEWLIAEIEKTMPDDIHFVGAHPMAGSHKSGVGSADERLFENSICILTPTESTDQAALNFVSDFWQALGAHVEIMSPQEHDYLIAAASHMPHALSCALVQVVSRVLMNDRKAIDFAATGFADMTRIAAGSPEVWKSILIQNADMVSAMLEKIEREISDIKTILCNKDENKLLEKLEESKHLRDLFRK